MSLKQDQTVGVIGGLGPKATLDFYAKLIEKTNAASDQDHLQVIINSNPKVPNRQYSLAGTGPSCAPHLIDSANSLKRAGADFLVMVCNTAHAYEDEIRQATQLPFISIVESSVQACLDKNPNIQRVGLLAANGCLDANLYQKSFEKYGIECVTPNQFDQAKLMKLIFRIKANDQDLSIALEMEHLAQSLIDQGAEIILGACTEVPLVLQEQYISAPLISSTDALVDAVVNYAQIESNISSFDPFYIKHQQLISA